MTAASTTDGPNTPNAVSSAPSSASTTERKTHIEVCVRIRPVQIGNESSNGFLIDQAGGGASWSASSSSGHASKLSPPRRSLRGSPPSAARGSPSSRLKNLFKRSTAASADPVDTTTVAWEQVSDAVVQQSAKTNRIQGRTHTYTVDQVYGPGRTTHHLFDHSVADLVHAAVDGYHTAVMAYGQTSTGKTHTMTGTTKEPGLIPLAVHECFRYIARQDVPKEYLIRVSYLEVYKEHIKDLLATSETAPPVRLFDTTTSGLVIKGLREEVVTSPEDVFRILARGERRRQISTTAFNQHSSRSHVLVRLWIEGRTAEESDSRKPSTSSSLSLVDLAGSESVRLTGSSERRQEGHYINQSLMTLGKVVYALSEAEDESQGEGAVKKKPQHVPYRDSKLTRLLQPSLSGNAQVVLICCISPLVGHLEESHNTFKFAIRAKKIPQKAVVQETADEQTLLQSYRQEIADLRQQLEDMKKLQQKQSTAESSTATVSSQSSVDLAEQDEEMQELAESIKKLEHLIIRSKAIASPLAQPEDLIDWTDQDMDEEDDDDMQKNLLALAEVDVTTPSKGAGPLSTPVTSPRDEKTDKDMELELARIQGILGSVLKKRRDERSTDEEVKLLRAQLEQHEETVSLRKADAAFLQKQLEEKDDLLQEVSKLLEAVEIRQSELEKENQRLRKEVATLRLHHPQLQNHVTPTKIEAIKTTMPPLSPARSAEEALVDDLDNLLGPASI